jgi:hypothetical protein
LTFRRTEVNQPMLADHTLASAFNSRSNSAVKNYGNATLQPPAGA